MGNHKCVKMVVSQANPVDQASDIEKPNTDRNKVEISFKKKDFQHSYVSGSSISSQVTTKSSALNNADSNSSAQAAAGSKPKKKQWRTLKQILTAEQSLPWPSLDSEGKKAVVTYSTIDAP